MEETTISGVTRRKKRVGSTSIVLAAHGSRNNPRSSKPVRRMARNLRSRDGLREVQTGFWKEFPSFQDAIRMVSGTRIYVVPVFMSKGYFVETVLSREVRLAENTPATSKQSITTTEPIGTHPKLSEIITDRTRLFLEQHSSSPSKTGLALIGHGTGRNPKSAATIRAHARRIRNSGAFGEVQAFFLDDQPGVHRTPERMDISEIVAVPVFVSDGAHTTRDIPNLLGFSRNFSNRNNQEALIEEISNKKLMYLQAVGTAPEMSRLILERLPESAGTTSETPHESRQPSFKRETNQIEPVYAGSRSERRMDPVHGDKTNRVQLTEEDLKFVINNAARGLRTPDITITVDEPDYRVQLFNRKYRFDHRTDLVKFLNSHPVPVTDLVYRYRSLHGQTPAQVSFLRWLERTGTYTSRERYKRLHTGLSTEWGELVITVRLETNGNRTFDIRHRADHERPRNELIEKNDPEAAFEIARRTGNGQYRAMPFFEDLQNGWVFAERTPGEAISILNHLYPGAIEDWYRQRRETLAVTDYDAFANRQTGRYQNVGDLSRKALQIVIESHCNGCVRTRRWQGPGVEGEQPPENGIPCREPCSILLETAREQAANRGNEQEPANANK